MAWLKQIIGPIVTIVALMVAGSISFGKLSARLDGQCTQMQAKADRASVERELDQIQQHLSRIEVKIDAALLTKSQE